MKIQQKRRELLFAHGRPTIRPYEAEDIKWLWAGARRAGGEIDREIFLEITQTTLQQADRIYIIEDRNSEFASGVGPVVLILATYDGWSLIPHAEYFPWTTTRNKLRCIVAYLQKQRYARGVACIKIHTAGAVQKAWFKKFKRYLPMYYVGAIPSGRPDGDEYIFYLRGRDYGSPRNRHGRDGRNKRDERRNGCAKVGVGESIEHKPGSDTPIPRRDTEHHDWSRVADIGNPEIQH